MPHDSGNKGIPKTTDTNNCHFQNYCGGAGDKDSPQKLPAHQEDSEFSGTMEMGLGQEEAFLWDCISFTNKSRELL